MRNALLTSTLMLLLCSTPAQSTNYTITEPGNDPATKDKCTLYGAIQNINNQNNSFYPACAPGGPKNQIWVATSVNVTHEMRLLGNATTTLKFGELVGSGITRLLRVSQDATLILLDMNLRNGNAGSSQGSGGAVLVENNGSLIAVRGGFFGNTAGEDGGAIAFESNGTLDIDHVLFDSNTAQDHGGAISLGGSTPFGMPPSQILGSKFYGNRADLSGGAIDCRSPQRRATVFGSNFQHNAVPSYDVGLCGGLSSFCDIKIEQSNFQDNRVRQGGGGAVYVAGPSSIIVDSYIWRNHAGGKAQDGEGGGIFIDGPTTVSKSSVFMNDAPEGGGIFVGDAASAHLDISNVTVSYNRAEQAGIAGHGGGVRFSATSYPRETFDDKIGYQPFGFEFINNSIIDNYGLEQLYFVPGSDTVAREILFANNVIRNPAVTGCGGQTDRMQLFRPTAPGTITGIQWPGNSCQSGGDVIPTYYAHVSFATPGGILGQVHHLPNSPGPLWRGDMVLCALLPVGGEDQFHNPRTCLIGAVEQSAPVTDPDNYYP